MSFNVISLVSQYLTPDMIAKIAVALGIDKLTIAGTAATAVIPSLLGVTGVAGTQQGSQKLYQAVAQQHPGVLDCLAVGSSLQKTVAGLKTSLQGVKDVDSARAALPSLQDAAAQVDTFSGLVNQLPASGKTALAAFFASVRPSLDEIFNKALAISGVAEVAKPTIDMIKGKLDAIAKA